MLIEVVARLQGVTCLELPRALANSVWDAYSVLVQCGRPGGACPRSGMGNDSSQDGGRPCSEADFRCLVVS